MAARPSSYLAAFREFIKDMRINSKEESSLEEGGIELKLWESQRRTLDFIGQGLDEGAHDFRILKSRQLGITTVTLGIDIFWMALHPGMLGALVVEKEGNALKNRALIEDYVKSFPEGYFDEQDFYVTKSNDQFIEFSNRSRLNILVAGTRKRNSTAWAEGSGYAYAHLTEVASYADEAGLDSLEESFAQVNPSRLYIYESTAKGLTGPWHKRYVEGLQDTFTKRSLFIGWWSGDTNRIEKGDPRFAAFGRQRLDAEEREKVAAVKTLYGWEIQPEQLAWFRWRTANPTKDEDTFAQNQPWTADEAFVQSGHSFFATRAIGLQMQHIAEVNAKADEAAADPTSTPDERVSEFFFKGYRYNLDASFLSMEFVEVEDEIDDIQLRVWEEPKPWGRYVIGADPAWGRTAHKDRHCASVWRCYADKCVQVAEFAANDIEIKQFAWVLLHLAGAYRDCLVNVELNGPGRVIMPEWDSIRSQLQSEYYINQDRPPIWEDALDQARWYLYHRPDSVGPGYAYNTEGTSRTQGVMMHTFRGEWTTKHLIVRSVPLLKEMLNVIDDDGHIGAPESDDEDCKDDRVYGGGLAVSAWVEWRRTEMASQNETYQIVTERERGDQKPIVLTLNAIVSNFFKRAAERESIPADPRPSWKRDRGLM